jgi:hypothetical protein
MIVTTKIWVDLDGTLADFDKKHVEMFGIPPDREDRTEEKDNEMWQIIDNHGTFFLDLEPLPDYLELWNFVKNFNPTILTGIPRTANASEQKKEWVSKYISPDVPVVCCKSREKFKHGSPGEVLLDDWEKYKHKWERMGGIFVTHTDAKSSIEKLKELGFR